jgi:hypothetical protein
MSPAARARPLRGASELLLEVRGVFAIMGDHAIARL